MKRAEALKRGQELLAGNTIEDSPLEAEILLRDTLNIDRATFYSDRDIELTPQQESNYWSKIERRVKGMPSAYITGYREFYGLRFFVDDSVLIPRQETELLVEKALACARNYDAPTMADIGTGCGCIAISLALNVPQSTVIATDISQRALNTTRCNCERHETRDRVQIYQGDLAGPVPRPVDVIVANLPYVRTADLPKVNTSGYEPRIALNGGEDGLDIIRPFCKQVGTVLKPCSSLLMEIGAGQKDAVVTLLREEFPSAHLDVFPDLTGIDRVVCLTLSR